MAFMVPRMMLPILVTDLLLDMNLRAFSNRYFRMKCRTQQPGITLIEMTVVVSILVILAITFKFGMARLESQSKIRAVQRMYKLVDQALYAYREIRPDFPASMVIEAFYRELVTVPEARDITARIDVTWRRPTPISTSPTEDRSDWPPTHDPWGRRFRYVWDAGTGDTFPLLRSSGPDKVYDTQDDILNR